MTASALTGFSRLCLHTMTTKPWSLREAIDGYVAAGVPAISVWRQHIDPVGAQEAGKLLRESGLQVVSLCRGGFFPALTYRERQLAIDDNLRAIDEAHEIGAPLVVLVCGAVPGLPLADARMHIAEGIVSVLPHAATCGVKLGIEPLHPMYADSRSAINTIKQANDIVDAIQSPFVGVTIDVYHLWWDAELKSEIERAGRSILSFHVCDWRTPTQDILNDRGLMGEGCINIREIRSWVEGAGFAGLIEVEIFSTEFWSMDQAAFVERIKAAYVNHC